MSKQIKTEVNPFDEARRYISNGKELLKKAGKEDGMYKDKKYVRLAGHAFWTGTLIAVEAITGIKGTAQKRVNVNNYKDAVSHIDSKMTKYLLEAYDSVHLHMGYDGTLNYKMVQAGVEQANFIIDWAEKIYKQRNKK